MNSGVGKNQHRWKKSLNSDICRVLDNAAKRLKWAWGVDMKDGSKSYPVNTDYAFYEIKEWIDECQQPSQPEVEHKSLKSLLKLGPPKCFSELVDDAIIKTVYEDRNAGSYGDALKCAASGDRSAGRAFRKILNAVKVAYVINHYGADTVPIPRVHFLHRNLLEIADLLHLGDLTHEGVVEFLDDLCPCRKRHTPEAIRKLRKRVVHRGPES